MWHTQKKTCFKKSNEPQIFSSMAHRKPKPNHLSLKESPSFLCEPRVIMDFQGIPIILKDVYSDCSFFNPFCSYAFWKRKRCFFLFCKFPSSPLCTNGNFKNSMSTFSQFCWREGLRTHVNARSSLENLRKSLINSEHARKRLS